MLVVETHMHTRVSDGKPTPREAVRTALRIGLDAIVVTDHNTFRGAMLAAREARGTSLVVVHGNEVRTKWGDVVVACPSLPSGSPPRDPLALREWAEENGCITVAVHPFNPFKKGVCFRLLRHPEAFHAMEVWNGWSPPQLNLPALLAWRKLRLPPTSGSDAHAAGMIGLSPTIIDSPASPDAIIDAIARGKCKPTIAIPGPGRILESLLWSIERRVSQR